MAVLYDADVCGRAALALVACFCIAGCDQKDPDVPDPGPEEIHVSPGDRLGWTQPAPDSSDIASLQFALYVDGTRSTLAGAACATAGASYNCSAVLPALTAGSHTLELAAFVGDGGSTAESARSAALRVVAVARMGAVFSSAPIPVVTVDQARLTLSPFVEGLSLPSDVACAHDGSIFVAERGGRVRLIRNGLLYPEPVLDLSAEVIAPQGGLVAIALDPEFEKSGFMFVLYAAAAPRQGQEFMLARFRGVKDTYGERAVELERREREHRLAADAEQAARLEVDALQARVRVRAYLVALGAKERPPKPPPRPEVAGDPPYPGAEWAAGDWRWEDTEWIWIDGSWSDPAWLEAGGDGGGIGLGLGAGAEVVGSLVRDHRTQRDPIIRDHRAQQDPVIRDHRTQQDPIIRDHRERRSDPPLVIRDHRGGKGSEPPIVRDHRESRSEPRPSRSESHEARSSKSKKDDDDDRKTITRDHRR